MHLPACIKSGLFVAWGALASLSSEAQCLLQKPNSGAVYSSRAFNQDLLASPLEGGPFSTFFNERVKGRGILKWLQYFPAYRRHFSKFIGKEVHIMEIGIQSGGSLEMWKQVFGPRAHVYGVDINPACKHYEDDRTKIIIGDQASPAFWANVSKQVPRIDILIDDGGHTPEQMITTLGVMLPRVAPGGVYVTEDVHGPDNGLWQRLSLQYLESPEGKSFRGLGSAVASVHIYPYLLVLERAGGDQAVTSLKRLAPDAAHGDTAEVPEVKAVLLGSAADAKFTVLRKAMPWLRWSGEEVLAADGEDVDLAELSSSRPPNGWLVASDGELPMDMDAAWDEATDKLLMEAVRSFKHMHDGTCCVQNATYMQRKVESLHVYPHLLVARRTGAEEVHSLNAPRHGTEWIPLEAPAALAPTAKAAAGHGTPRQGN